MTEYQLDVSADQIVRWLKGEIAAGRPLEIRASREYVAEPLAEREDAGLTEETEAAVLTTVGTLEAWPVGRRDAWRLQLRIEDVMGPHLPEDESVPEEAEDIDLDTFEAEFVKPDRGTAFASVIVDSPASKRSFDQAFRRLVRDRHAR
jgi:hypothetical protein